LKTVTFDANKLLAVDKIRLEYVDDQGCRCAIDFRSCRENLQKKLKMTEEFRTRHPDYVGFRDIAAHPPYITLASDPPTRFLFPVSAPAAGFLRSDFDQFQARLRDEAGVDTLDMS
jgi:hypothetical protein